MTLRLQTQVFVSSGMKAFEIPLKTPILSLPQIRVLSDSSKPQLRRNQLSPNNKAERRQEKIVNMITVRYGLNKVCFQIYGPSPSLPLRSMVKAKMTGMEVVVVFTPFEVG